MYPWTEYSGGVFMTWRGTNILDISIVRHRLVETAKKFFVYRWKLSVAV